MDIVAFVLNTVIGVVLVGGTIGFLMQAEPPATATVFNGVPEDVEPAASPSVQPGPCPTSSSTCAGPSYVPPTQKP